MNGAQPEFDVKSNELAQRQYARKEKHRNSNGHDNSARSYVSCPSYSMSEQGLYYVETGEDEDGKPKEKRSWLSSAFEVLAQTRDDNSKSWGKALRWHDPDRHVHEWAMPDRMLGGDHRELWRELIDGGLQIAPSTALRNKLAAYLSSVKVEDRARAVDRVGWHRGPGGLVFVLPDVVLGENGERVLFQTEARIEVPYITAGTAEEWRDRAGKLCVGNSRIVFGVSLAFAGPLLFFAEEVGGGFNYDGASQTGKTVTQRVSGSVWGGDFLETWRATANGLEGVAAAHCDTFLPLDEMGQVSPQDAGETAYMLANGTGKIRASRSGGLRHRVKWRNLFLSSGEVTLADKLGEIGRRPRAGQEVRLVDIPSDAGASHGMFEDLHGSASGGVFAERLRAAASRYYGTASP